MPRWPEITEPPGHSDNESFRRGIIQALHHCRPACLFQWLNESMHQYLNRSMIQSLNRFAPCDMVFTGCRHSSRHENSVKLTGLAKWMCRPCAVFLSPCKKASSSRLSVLREAGSPPFFTCWED